jgi:type II secretion system protein G
MNYRLRQAFTMLEMMAVVALLAVLMWFIFPRVTKWLGKSEEAKIKLQFANIKEALSEYRLMFGGYPTSKEGLRALIQNPRPNDDKFKREASKWPFLSEDNLVDAQSNEFVYHCPPEKFKNKYRYFELIWLGRTQSEDDPDRVDDGI